MANNDMINHESKSFEVLEIGGNNYLSWQSDAKLHLRSKKILDAIDATKGKSMTDDVKASALIFLRRHIHGDLKTEYMHVDEPSNLWLLLKNRFENMALITKPNAQLAWEKLRFQDHTSVASYNNAIYNIVARLKMCGVKIDDAEMIERTLSTFHANNVILQQQYRERKYKTYAELSCVLLLAEEQNKVLIQNHNSRPTGSEAIPEANASFDREKWYRNFSKRGGYNPSFKRGGRYNSRGGGRNNYYGGRGGNNGPRNTTHFKKNYTPFENIDRNKHVMCYRCGKIGHYASECKASNEVVNKYQNSLKNVETNMTFANDIPTDNFLQLKCNDFFEDGDGKPITNEDFEEMLGNPPI